MEPVSERDMRRQVWVQSTRPELEGRLGTLFSLSNGTLGIRGAHEETPSWGRCEFYVAGTYAAGPATLLGFHDPDHILTHPDRIRPEFLARLSDAAVSTLPNLPWPLAVELTVGGVRFSHESAGTRVLSNERLLDMAEATLRRTLVFRDAAGRRTRVDSARFVSFADANLLCLRYRVRRLDHAAPVEVRAGLKEDVTNTGGVVLWRAGQRLTGPNLTALECVTHATGHRVAIAQRSVVRPDPAGTTLELFVVAGTGALDDAAGRAEAAARKGFDALHDEHRAAWRRLEEQTAVEFDGDAATVQGFRFGQMHLRMALGDAAAATGVPIKGLTGHGYRFCNFWDTDFHMFPYYLLTQPRRARGLLEYRYRQLDAYRANARLYGCQGAQVPWETQADGAECTAPWLCLQDREIHISADAARMFWLYDELTGDASALEEMGAEFAFETARFYASRARPAEAGGRYDLPDVGCPDQYHTFADNNFFINLMARWNLQWAAELAADARCAAARRKVGLADEEVARWQDVAQGLHVAAPNAEGIIEEFDGFFGLSGDLDGICETYCRHSQAVKQPDVLAAFWPFEDLYDEPTRRANWRFYAARTLHGSSLSLPGMAHAAARCGLSDEALDYLQRSVRMDLDDVNLDSERGVHVSGGALEWYTAVFGFGGLTPRREGLHFRPRLPRQWSRLAFRVHWRMRRLDVTLTRRRIRLHAPTGNGGEVVVRVGDGAPIAIAPGEHKSVAV